MGYLNLQNKALRQGVYITYVTLPNIPVVFTTNGHIMVRGKVHELKPLKDQYDMRDDNNITALTDKRWLADFKDMHSIKGDVDGGEHFIAGGNTYQGIYIAYVMARYPVAEWKLAGKKLVAVDVKGNIIAVIAPYTEPKVEVVERKNIKQTEERGNA